MLNFWGKDINLPCAEEAAIWKRLQVPYSLCVYACLPFFSTFLPFLRCCYILLNLLWGKYSFSVTVWSTLVFRRAFSCVRDNILLLCNPNLLGTLQLIFFFPSVFYWLWYIYWGAMQYSLFGFCSWLMHPFYEGMKRIYRGRQSWLQGLDGSGNRKHRLPSHVFCVEEV